MYVREYVCVVVGGRVTHQNVGSRMLTTQDVCVCVCIVWMCMCA